MAKYLAMILVSACLILLFSFAAPMVEASDWQCQWTVVDGAVTGGTISGRGCRLVNFANWEVWADTYLSAPPSPQIYTRVIGYDLCAGFGWVQEMFTDHNDFNTTYGTSGNPAYGSFQDCQTGHYYRVEGWHEKWEPSTNRWEGYSGNVDW